MVIVIVIVGRVGMDANRQTKTVAVGHVLGYGVKDPIADRNFSGPRNAIPKW